jgi:hypothetical protein
MINGMAVRHYAGPVVYNAKEFLVKNADSAPMEMINLFCNSKNDVTKQLLLPMLEFIQKCMCLFLLCFLCGDLWKENRGLGVRVCVEMRGKGRE